MSEYYMSHTGKELDDAINKVRSGYILPSETINIIENISNMDIASGKILNVNVPIPDGYIRPGGNVNITTNGTHNVKQYENAVVNVPIKYFSTGVVANITSGQQLTVTGIKDSVTGETFTPKGIVCFISPTSVTNYTTAGSKGAMVAFCKDLNMSDNTGIAAFSTAYSVRIHPSVGSSYVTISGNSFTYSAVSGSMYGLMAANRWRWFAWG